MTEPVEVGVDLAPTSCPSCGEELQQTPRPDGSVSSETHAPCYTKAAEAASAANVPVETGVTGGSDGG